MRTRESVIQLHGALNSNTVCHSKPSKYDLYP